MPTVILLDVSLSMSRLENAEDKNTRVIDVASRCISKLLDQFSMRCKLEYTALVVFSSLYEVLVKFTRNIETLKKSVSSFQTYDKTMIECALQGVESLVTDEWGTTVPINLIIVTDGSSGIGEGSLKESLKTLNTRKPGNRFPLPFSFPCHLSIICLSNKFELKTKQNHLEQLLRINNDNGELLIPDSLNEVNVMQCFTRLLNLHYNKHEATLKCGLFESYIMLSPSPNFKNSYMGILNLYRHSDEELNLSKLKLNSVLHIVGYLDMKDFSNPPYMSRHLVSPVASLDDDEQITNKTKEMNGLQPSFCVLLHGSLKIERMGAVVLLWDNWYGMLYSCSDIKKKSNLMLSIFEPGQPFPWLGDMKNLGPANELNPNPYHIDANDNVEESPFPVPPVVRRSYHAQLNTVWIKCSGLQSDIQKLLRYAKKLPEKQSAFFKEVNKLRRAGVIYGFHEMLNALANALEHEGKNMLPEVNVQLQHVAEGLRNAPQREVNKNIIAISMFRKKSTEP